MKVEKLRALLAQAAEMQRGLGDEVTGQALRELGEVLRIRDNEEVAKVVENIKQRREDRSSK
jgi:hypothetical protein